VSFPARAHAPARPRALIDRIIDPRYRRNFLVFLGDYYLFITAISFAAPSTVLPSLVRALTPSTPLIGLVETIRTGVWLVPQMFVAWFLAGRVVRRRHVIAPVLVGRIAFLCLVPVVLFLPGVKGTLALSLFFLCLAIFYAGDGSGTLAWLELFSATVPAEGRARLVGIVQTLSGITGIGAGAFVAWTLGSGRIAFPGNFAVLLAAAGFFMILEVVVLSFLKPPADAKVHPSPARSFSARLASILRTDPQFRLFVLVRLLAGAGSMAAPFYMVFALDVLGLGSGSIGVFTAAQVIGGILSAPLMARMGERRGTRAVIRLSTVLVLCVPLAGLGVFALHPLIGGVAALSLYAVLFVLLGSAGNGSTAGFMNYLLEFSPAQERPAYVGMANTLNGLVFVAPLLGGWIVAASSYPMLFAVTAAISLAAVFGARKLKEPRVPDALFRLPPPAFSSVPGGPAGSRRSGACTRRGTRP